MLLRLIASFYCGWDGDVMSRVEYVIYIVALSAASLVAILKITTFTFVKPVQKYEECVYKNSDTGRIYMVSSLTLKLLVRILSHFLFSNKITKKV